MGCIHGLKAIYCTDCKRLGHVDTSAPVRQKPVTVSEVKQILLPTPIPKPLAVVAVPAPSCVPKPIEVRNKSVRPSRQVARAKRAEEEDWILLRTKPKEAIDFGVLDDSTLFVHVSGHLFLWVLERILELAPNLKAIRIIPKDEHTISDLHRKVLSNREVQLVFGHKSPRTTERWRTPSLAYRIRQGFLRNLSKSQAELFENLRALNDVGVKMLCRYYCLDGEEYLPEHLVAKEYGYTEDGKEASRRIQAVLFCLDPSFPTGKASQHSALKLMQRLKRAQEAAADEAWRRDFESRWGIVV